MSDVNAQSLAAVSAQRLEHGRRDFLQVIQRAFTLPWIECTTLRGAYAMFIQHPFAEVLVTRHTRRCARGERGLRSVGYAVLARFLGKHVGAGFAGFESIIRKVSLDIVIN